MIYDIRDCMYIYFFQMPPQVICQIHGPPSLACLGCKCLLNLGRTWGVVTLSRWCVSRDRGGRSFRKGLKSKFYQFTHTMVTAGIFPFKENSRHYTNWPIRTPIFKRFRFGILARILDSPSERFRGVIQSLQQTPGEYFKMNTSRLFYYTFWFLTYC
jgi:hypothetical protein